jgi:hypothetical protein
MDDQMEGTEDIEGRLSSRQIVTTILFCILDSKKNERHRMVFLESRQINTENLQRIVLFWFQLVVLSKLLPVLKILQKMIPNLLLILCIILPLMERSIEYVNEVSDEHEICTSKTPLFSSLTLVFLENQVNVKQ